MAVAAGASELVGGALFAAGLLTPVGAALISATMITAMLTVHAGKGLWMTEGRRRVQPRAGRGGLRRHRPSVPGKWSLDHALGLHVAGVEWAVGELAVGLVARC
jgi:putative oxidoreductase